MDFVTQRQIKEWLLLGLVALMAIIANLPDELLKSYGLNPQLMLAILGVVVVLALFLYLRFFFFMLYVLLAVGANLPDQWAQSMGISQTPLLVALIFMVIGSLLNYSAKMVPVGLEPKPKKQSAESIQALIVAIDRGQMGRIRTILGMGYDLNQAGSEGDTPLMRAAKLGNLIATGLLLKYGAAPSMRGPDGSTAEDLARRGGHDKVVALLRSVTPKEKPAEPVAPDAPTVMEL